MSDHLRPLAVGTLVAALLAVAAPSAAEAFVTTDLRWSLGESTTTYGNGRQFTISQSGDGLVQYRWLDADMTKTTVISGNSCTDYYLFGKATFPGGDTSYRTLFAGETGQCFVVRGRTNNGTTIPHDARLKR